MSFIKWMGGKSKVLHLFKDYFPDFSKIDGYIEPFLGAGSVFFYLKENGYLEGKNVYLSDINAELINTHIQVRDNLDELIPLLEKHQKLNCREHYDKVKKVFPPGIGMTDIEKAAAFIYLVNNAMGGMWRVNSQGKFNSSYGNNTDNNLIKDELFLCSKLLQGTDIRCHSFEKILEIERERDIFAYLDPPYFNVDSTDGCYRYAKDQFCINTRLTIPKVFKELDKRGNKVMMSNSNHPNIYTYFKDYNIIQIYTDRRKLALNKITKEAMNNVKKQTEVIVLNYNVVKKQKTIDDAWD